MHRRLLPVLVAVTAFTSPSVLMAQSQCDAYFSLDGNLNDSNGSGIEGRMIGKEGAAATPQFVDGRSGQALKLDGSSAMRAFVDLNYENCKQVTMTAWVLFEPGRPGKTVNIISTGGGSGPGLAASGSTLILKGTANGIGQSNAIRENAGWMFVAGVYDYEGDEYTLHWRGRSETRPLGPNRRVPEEAIWIGALNDGLSGAASGVVVDELRIYGRILSDDEIRAIEAGKAPALAAPDTSQLAAASCAKQEDCGTGSYCAFDRVCHPESHLPMRQIEMIVAPAPVQTVDFATTGTSGSTSGGTSATSSGGLGGGLPAGVSTFDSGMSGTISPEMTDAMAEQANATRPPDIGYASEEEALAAAERREREAYEAEMARQQNELEQQRRDAAADEQVAQMPAPDVNAVMDLQTIEILRQNESRGDEYYLVTYTMRGRRGADDRIHVFDYADQVWPIVAGDNWAKKDLEFSIPQGAGRLVFDDLKPFEVYGFVVLLMEANNSSVSERTAAFGFGEFQNEQGVVGAISSAFERAIPRNAAMPDYSNTSCENVQQVFNENYQGISIQFGNYELRNSGLSKAIQDVIEVPLKGNGTDIFDGAFWAFYMNVPGGASCLPGPPGSKAFVAPGKALSGNTFSTQIRGQHSQYE